MSRAASAAGAPAGAPPPPPPHGGQGGGDRRKSGSGKDSSRSKKKQRRSTKRRGRPLQAMERMQIMGIWSQISVTARRSLWETLGEMLGETPVSGSDEPAVSRQAENTQPSRRERVWERAILRDVPLFQEFGNLTARQRREDTRNVPRLLSIAQGVVRRGRELHITDQEILTAIITALDDADTLRALYGGPPGDDVSTSSCNEEMSEK